MAVITAKNKTKDLVWADFKRQMQIILHRNLEEVHLLRDVLWTYSWENHVFFGTILFFHCNEFASVLAIYEAEEYIVFIYHKKGRTMTTKTKTGNKGFKLESKLHATKKVWKCMNHL